MCVVLQINGSQGNQMMKTFVFVYSNPFLLMWHSYINRNSLSYKGDHETTV